MSTLGATLGDLSPGRVEIELRPHPAISQQHGFIHAGAISAIADTAAGRTLTLAQTEVFAETGGEEKLVALLTATMMTIDGRKGVVD